MQNQTWLSLIIACSIVYGFTRQIQAQEDQYRCRWHDASMHFLTPDDYSVEGNIRYLLSNNKDYLYINLLIPSEIDQRKILVFGNTLRLEMNGKRKKTIAVKYPVRDSERAPDQPGEPMPGKPMPGEPMPEEPMPGGRPATSPRRTLIQFDSVKHELADRSRWMELHRYTDTAEVIRIPATNPMEVHGWMAYDSSGILHYTVVVPLSRVPLDTIGGTTGFGLEMETGYFDRERMRQRIAARAGERGNYRARPDRGQRPPDGRSRPSDGRLQPSYRRPQPSDTRLRPPGTGQSQPEDGQGRLTPGQRMEMIEILEALSVPAGIRIRHIRLAEE